MAENWVLKADKKAMHKIITAYSKLVIAYSMKFKNYGLPISDLVQEGHIGLMQAIGKFEPSRDIRFSTYASWWIRSAIQDYVLKNWSIVRTGTTASQKALFFSLRRLKLELGKYSKNEEEITKNFKEQAKALNPYIDFFYFDVLSSIKEFKCGIRAIKEFKKTYLIGIHISEGKNLPSGEKISEIKEVIDNKALGVILSCISPENYEANLKELKNLGVPFGFKLNGYITTKPSTSYTENYLKSKTGNPIEVLGRREDLTPENMARIVKKFKDAGATILGGCCETRPSHIEAMAKLK